MAHSWPLVGRQEELALINGVLAGSDEQCGVVLAGNAGVGKSRLAREAAVAAERRGWAVRWVVGTVGARNIPLGAFAAWTDGVDGNPLELVRQVIDAITAAADFTPVLVAVDDMHLLDDFSSFVLHQLVLHSPAWVIGTLRGGQTVPDAVSALWKDGHLRRLEVQSLSRAETDELLAAALGDAVDPAVGPRVWELTAGNALFVRELVEQERAAGRLARRDRTWRWDGPVHVSTSLIDLVELQIGAVPDAVGEVVDLVALGDPLDRATLIAAVDPTALELAERRGLIAASGAGSGDTIRIGHPLYGEVRLAKCGRLRLRRLRGRLATAMSGTGTLPDPVRMALLWLESDLPPDSDIFLRGAHAAFLRIDLENAGRLAEAAVASGADIAAQLLLAHALTLLNRGEDAAVILESFRADDVPEPVWAQVVHAQAANLMWPLGRPEQSWAAIDDALTGASESLAAELLSFRTMQLGFGARPAEALDIAERIDTATVSAAAALVAAWGRVIALGDLGRPNEAAAAAALGYARAANSPEAAYQGVGLTEFHVTALLLAGEIAAAVAAADQAYRLCFNVPGISRSVATAVAAMAAMGAGDLRAASAQLTSAVGDFTAHSDQTGVFYRFAVVFVEVMARSGRVDEARTQLERMAAARHPTFVVIEPDALLARAWVDAASGRMGHARHFATRAAAFARDHGQWAREVWCLQTAVGFRDTTVAGRLAELAEIVQGPRAPAAARYARALSAADGASLAAASEEFEAFGDRLTAAEAAALAAVAFIEAGRRGSALTARTRADRLAAECGAVLRPGLRATRLPIKLSGREREIATLVADGLTNKQIATALTLSTRTVEGHLYRICTRLSLNRAELAHLAAGCAPHEVIA